MNPNGKYMDIDKAIDACTIIQRFWRSKNLIIYRPRITQIYYNTLERDEYNDYQPIETDWMGSFGLQS